MAVPITPYNQSTIAGTVSAKIKGTNKTVSVNIVVDGEATGLDLLYGGNSVTDKTLSMVEGDMLTLEGVSYPIDSNKVITYESSDEKVATIGQYGNVKAVGEGEATITASIEGIKPVSAKIYVSAKKEYQQFTYVVLHDDTVRILSCAGSGDIVIPEKIDGKSVTAIGDYAFRTCIGAKSVTIPKGVTNISDTAFVKNLQKELLDIIIVGEKGSYAEQYAKEKGLPFEVTDGRVVPNTSSPTVEEPTKPGESQKPTDEETTKPGENTKPGESQRPTDGETTKPGESQRPTDEETMKPGESQRPTDGETAKPGESQKPTDEEIMKPGESQKPTDEETMKPGESQKPTDGETTKPGEINIPTDGEEKDDADLKVTSSITVYAKGTKNKTKTITVKYNGIKVEGVTYTSMDTDVATVDEAGVVTAVKKGATYIKVSYVMEGKNKESIIPVTVKNASLKITKKVKKLKVDKSFVFKASKVGLKETITWKVSNKKIATIGKKTGKLVAKKAGKVTVIAKCGNFTKKVTVVIK